MSKAEPQYLFPEWPASSSIRAAVTTRGVEENWAQVQSDLGLKKTPIFLKQVHGADVTDKDQAISADIPCLADACYTRTPETVCSVYTADCLPILICDRQASVVAAIHAGWRGLLAGVINNTIEALRVSPESLLAWLGPAIGPDHFEVNVDIREAYLARYSDFAEGFFQPGPNRWFADLYRLARINLRHCGVEAVFGGGLCTFCDAERFYSYRRDKDHGLRETQRMSSLIWITNPL